LRRSNLTRLEPGRVQSTIRPKQPISSEEAMKNEKIEPIVNKWLEAWPRHDAKALAAAFAEDAVYTSMLAGTIRGPKEIEALYQNWFRAFPDMEFQVESRIIHRNQAAILWSQNGTHMGELCGLPGTGRIFVLPGSFHMAFREGRIVSMRSIYDFTGLLVQIGILKAKPAD
jgi:steroid delta-isomerase-like uncharacterized protein